MQREPIPVVELLRVSTADQADEDRAGLPRQEEANRRTIARHGLRVITSYRLVDVSGASTLYAPEVQAMLSLLREGRARGIVTADFDRLLRPDDFRSLAILQDIKEAGALIYLPDQILDLNTQAGFLMSGLQSVIAGNELAQIKKRMIGAKEEKRRQGKHPGNDLCLPTGVGYDRRAGEYFYTPDAERVREVFELFHGQGVQNLCDVGRRTGFSSQTVKNLLRNELFIGWRHYKQKRSPDRRLKEDGRRADRRKVARAPHETIRVQVIQNPLVSEDVFWAVQESLAKKRDGFTSRREDSSGLFLFKGLLRCGVCGSPMYTVPGGKYGPVKDYYYCRNLSDYFVKKNGGKVCGSHYLRRLEVEDVVISFIAENLANAERIMGYLSQVWSVESDLRREREAENIKTKLARLEKKRKRAISLHLDGVIERGDLNATLLDVDGEVQRLSTKLAVTEETPTDVSRADLLEMATLAAEAFSMFPFWGKDDQRRFLAAERPQFWLQEGRVTRFTLPVGGKKQNRKDRDSSPPRA